MHVNCRAKGKQQKKQEMDAQLLQLLNTYGEEYTFPGGTVLLRDGQYIKWVPLVLGGSIKVVREDQSGRELLLYLIVPGESCVMTLLAVQQNTPSRVRAEVAEAARVLLLPVDAVRRHLSSRKDWLDFIFGLFSRRYEELLQMVQEVAFNRVDERLVDLLRLKCSLQKGPVLRITHQQLADELGTAREVVSRLLKRLEEEQMVRTERGVIHYLGAW